MSYVVGYKGGEVSRAVEREGSPVADLTEAVFVQINAARRNLGLDILRRNDNLFRVAQEHANRWQAHLDIPDDPLAFAQARHYTGQAVDYLDSDDHDTIHPIEIVDDWLADADAKEVLADADWNEIGVGIGGSPYRVFIAVYFGNRLNWHLPELDQDSEEIGLRDGLSFREIPPL